MPVKEELFKEAMELAQKCRGCKEELEEEEKQKEDVSLQPLRDKISNFIRYSSMLAGFCRALVVADIFGAEDVRELWGTIYPELRSSSSETILPPGIADFIKGLDVDDL